MPFADNGRALRLPQEVVDAHIADGGLVLGKDLLEHAVKGVAVARYDDLVEENIAALLVEHVAAAVTKFHVETDIGDVERAGIENKAIDARAAFCKDQPLYIVGLADETAFGHRRWLGLFRVPRAASDQWQKSEHDGERYAKKCFHNFTRFPNV